MYGISIHALLAESDIETLRTVKVRKTFLSTLSLRRATHCWRVETLERNISIHALLAESDFTRPFASHFKTHFYPRSPCGERPRAGKLIHHSTYISIHALLAESDATKKALGATFDEFLSTLSLRRATFSTSERLFIPSHYFYPRSPCGERRSSKIMFSSFITYFYPRSPCGERHISSILMYYITYFYPRSPCGERQGPAKLPKQIRDFYPRSPCGERHAPSHSLYPSNRISIHALLAESDIC